MRLLYILLLLCYFCPLAAQEYNYVHYNEQHGLAGSTVYDMCQDKDGFMWFATESGLSRYDGTRFVNFTTKNGLPDNEVLRLLADSKGRIWIGALNKELSYYYKGKIYNSQNTAWLRKLELTKFPSSIAEAKDTTVIFSDGKHVYGVTKQDNIFKIEGSSFEQNAALTVVGNRLGNTFVINGNNMSYYVYNPKQKSFNALGIYPQPKQGMTNQATPANLLIYDLDGMGNVFPKLKKIPDATRIDTGINQTYWFNTGDGAWLMDTISDGKVKHFLPRKTISRTVIDSERNTWFATLGDGVYKLPSQSFIAYNQLGKSPTKGNEVFSFGKHMDNLVAGVGFSKAILLNKANMVGQLNYEKQWNLSTNPFEDNRLFCIKTVSNNITLLGFDAYLVKLENNTPTFQFIFPIKSIEVVNADYFIIGTARFAFKMRLKDLSITDTIWHNRCTNVCYANEKYYIGTINGLYEVKQDKSSNYLGAIHPALSRRIIDIKKDGSGILWIATSDAGIVAYKNGKVIYEVNEKKGLASDICRTLFWQPPYLWVGTNKGLSKINTNLPGLPVITYSMADGLASNFVNAVYIEDSTVYTGTPTGITLFNENAVMSISSCNLNMLGISIGGRDTAVLDSYDIPWRRNSIGFEYIAISFKSAGDITYRYRLQGLDTGWLQTKNTNINYPSLPAGEYTFFLEAINKFGVKSKTLQVTFIIGAPFWKKWWFYLMLSILTLGSMVWIMNKRNKKLRGRLEERNRVQRQLVELEQQALQSQMNPHFIFNCLNSIQQFIVLTDIQAANRYLTAFARLIRQTLDNSAKKALSINEELTYLSSYLELEKMRFDGRFMYELTIDNNIDKQNDWIPSMLVQPFVENSIRHGLADKREDQGTIKVSFRKEEGNIICTITDNGIGRIASAKRKSTVHLEQRTKSMSLTQKRIDLINQNNDSHIQLTIKDLYHDGTMKAAGTAITLTIPQQ